MDSDMPYPDNFSARAYDAAQGRDETPEPDAEDCYDAARDLLHAIDRGFVTINRPKSGYIAALRRAVAAETARRVADEAELRATCERLRILGRVG